MTRYRCTLEIACPSQMRLFGQILSLKLHPGDVVTLRGDVGAGKTTLARNIIRAVASDDELEVPSPTYSLMQSYITQRFVIRHYDFYRLTSTEELQELGFAEDLENVVSLIEWPQNVAVDFPEEHIEISLKEIWRDQIDCRAVQLTAGRLAALRIQRALDIWFFLQAWGNHQQSTSNKFKVSYLQGDASARSYARLHAPNHHTILMDYPCQPDGPPIRDGLPYSRIAHLAENIRPFIAIGSGLSAHGCSVPATYEVDIDNGLAIIEDLGSGVFGSLIANGHEIEPLYRRALDVLIHLNTCTAPLEVTGHKCTHILPKFDQTVMEIEIELMLNWYIPFSLGRQATDGERARFLEVWRQEFARLEEQSAWVLRDYHSPNLIWLPDREGLRQVGLIDYQDALIGHSAYDVVSLLQDARLEISQDTEQRLLSYYFDKMQSTGQNYDEMRFKHAYALLGAQRNTKILGIFARLAKRDGKRQYLHHIPRICNYLQRCFEHPELHKIRALFAAQVPHVLHSPA